MYKKIFLLVFTILCIGTINLAAQTNDDSTQATPKEHHWKWFEWNKHEWFKWRFHGKPFMELNYGLGIPKHDKLVSKFADVGMLELKLGYVTKEKFYEDDLIDFKEKYVFVSKIGSQLKKQDIALGNMETNLWRIGFAQRSGYGYDFDDIKILPYHETGFAWSRLDVQTYPAQFYLAVNPPLSLDDARNDTDILNRFHDANRFGTVWEGGARVEFVRHFSVNAGYEAAVIFPRHMFWKHAGSFIIEEVGLHLLDQFIDEVANSSPYAAPVINFILKNGFSYAFYTLKKEKMNWPFDTEAPLTYETFKLGVTFTF